MTRLTASTLVALAVTTAGCAELKPFLDPTYEAKTPADDHEYGKSAKSHFFAANQALATAATDEDAKDKAKEESEACTRSVNALTSIHYSHGRMGPVYDADKDTLATSAGILTLTELSKRCREMTRQLNVRAELPKPAVQNAALEKTLLEAARAAHPGSNYLSAIITSSDFGILRHPTSGVVVGREREAVFPKRMKDGTCWYQYLYFQQEYVGDQFSGGFGLRGVGASYEVSCAALPAPSGAAR